MKGGLHRAETYRCAVPGIEAFALFSDRTFPRHAHDQLGIGVLAAGGHRSWSGRGPVEAGPGDVITVNPGEMHDGTPVAGQPRAWRMLYIDPAFVARTLAEDLAGEPEIVRPALHDPALACRIARLFARLTASPPDALEAEEGVVRTLAHLLDRHGARSLPRPAPPAVARALNRLTDAPERAVTLSELAALAGVGRFQLLRGFAHAVGATPHAYLLQQRVRLARRLLVAGCSPAAAAAAAGFADQSHLTRAFRRQLGVTPARYRAAVA